MKKRLDTNALANELKGASLFFVSHRRTLLHQSYC
jgi:hypothetical protein